MITLKQELTKLTKAADLLRKARAILDEVADEGGVMALDAQHFAHAVGELLSRDDEAGLEPMLAALGLATGRIVEIK